MKNKLLLAIILGYIGTPVSAQTITGSGLEITAPDPRIMLKSESAGQTIDANGSNNGWPGLVYQAYDQQGGPLVTKWEMTYSARDDYLYFYNYTLGKKAFWLKDGGGVVFQTPLEVSATNVSIGLSDLVGSTFSLQSTSEAFRIYDNSKTAERFRIDPSGNIGIGTANPGTHKLAVNGSIRAKEVVVDTNWSDFVFAPDYQLRSLEEVELHIAEHGHLPDVPSASVIESSGLSVGEAQKIMMQKIEELTLYVIELEKRSQSQQRLIDSQQEEIESLKVR